MRKIKDVTERIKTVKINPFYDASVEQMLEIIEANDNAIDLFGDAFKFGYMQGVKADKAERR